MENQILKMHIIEDQNGKFIEAERKGQKDILDAHNKIAW